MPLGSALVQHLFWPAVAGVVSGLAAGAVLVVASPWIVENTASFKPPSCDDTQQLRRLDLTDMLSKEEAQLEAADAEPTEKEPNGRAIWRAEGLFDGKANTFWTPANTVKKPQVSITFRDREYDIRLVCVVNGAATTSWAYLRADRVRTFRSTRVDAAGARHSRTAPVKTMDEFGIQNRQILQFNAGKSRRVEFMVIDRYEGRKVQDPDIQEWVEPTGLLAVAEVELYVSS